MLRAVRPEASIDTVEELKLCRDVGCDPVLPSRAPLCFDRLALTRTATDAAGAPSNFLSLQSLGRDAREQAEYSCRGPKQLPLTVAAHQGG